MTCQLDALSFDAVDPVRLAGFWAGLLGWEVSEDAISGVTLLPNDDTGFRIRFVPTGPRVLCRPRERIAVTTLLQHDHPG